MITKITGIIISEQEFSETSKIINVLTNDDRIIGIICKGANRMKSKFFGKCTLLTFADFNIYYKKDKLCTLISIDTINMFVNSKNDILKYSYACYILDLAYQVSKEEVPSGTFELTKEAIVKINEGINPNLVANSYALKLLEPLGCSMDLNSCSKCGNKTNLVTISIANAGYLCSNCAVDEKVVPRTMLILIRKLLYTNLSDIEDVEFNSTDLKLVTRFINEYYDAYSGIYLKSRKLLYNLQKLT